MSKSATFVLPSNCSCGQKFNIEHALTWSKGGFISLRHNELRDTTPELLNEVCKDVKTEPKMAELTGEKFKLRSTNTDNEARLDISCRGFWGEKVTKLFKIFEYSIL